MNLTQTSATILLVLIAAYVIMFNILEIPYKDVIRSPGFTNATVSDETSLSKEDLAKIEQDNESISLSDIEQDLRREFGVNQNQNEPITHLNPAKLQNLTNNCKGYITNKIPDSLIQQAVYNPEQSNGISASNQDLHEKEALFGSEQTNISQFFANNPGVFFNEQRHNAYVPDVSKWNNEGQKLYSDRMNAPSNELNPYNYKSQCNVQTLL